MARELQAPPVHLNVLGSPSVPSEKHESFSPALFIAARCVAFGRPFGLLGYCRTGHEVEPFVRDAAVFQAKAR